MLPDRYSLLPDRSPIHGAPIYWCRATGSTMDDAREAGVALSSGTVLMTDEQTAGRGRGAGRKWQAAAGENLLFTLVVALPDAVPPGSQAVGSIPLRAGVAVAESVGALGVPHTKLRIKWPNDVLIDGAKVCGILCEGRGGRVHIGIGLNLNQLRFDVGPVLFPPTSVAAETGNRREPREVLGLLLQRLATDLKDPAWRSRVESMRYGEVVRFMDGAEGRIFGIGEHGELLVERSTGGVECVLQPDQLEFPALGRQ